MKKRRSALEKRIEAHVQAWLGDLGLQNWNVHMVYKPFTTEQREEYRQREKDEGRPVLQAMVIYCEPVYQEATIQWDLAAIRAGRMPPAEFIDFVCHEVTHIFLAEISYRPRTWRVIENTVTNTARVFQRLKREANRR